ncbi:methenyltetrahydromethanopterin cyclohydrolase [archaeon BMS3Abin16]|nr:methenyltetrahydromethanopterin cyclohydrolase [archaeon BMS3Abin16]HDY73572.1 methenyltetrahydromethanopterin cyclohydrolase [Euryarchaeota archaeon]
MTLNENALEIAGAMIEGKDRFGVEEARLECGATVVDCGVNAVGSVEAGLLFSRVCLGGLAEVAVSNEGFGALGLPVVSVRTDAPRLACIGSQKAGWSVKVGGFFGMGSGPARMLLDSAPEGLREDSDVGVLALECSVLPGDDVAEYVAGKLGIDAGNLTILAVRTASVAGSVQVSARMVETALFKMDHLEITADIVSGEGTAPIAPVKGGDSRMMGVENDMIIYGSSVKLTVSEDVDVEAIPSVSSPEYGVPFAEIFKRAGYDFYKIDQGIFAPAQVTVENIASGEIKIAGEVNFEMVEKTINSS